MNIVIFVFVFIFITITGISLFPCYLHSQIERIDLNEYQLRGRFSNFTQWTGLTTLTELYLSHNNLEGAIPKELSALERLQYLRLDHNHLSGQLPTELQLLTNIRMADFSGNEQLEMPLGVEDKYFFTDAQWERLTGMLRLADRQ